MAKNSNLGDYQIMTTVAKFVGGPKYLLGGIFFASISIWEGTKYIIKKHKENQEESNNQIYEVKNYGVSNEGLEFNIGDIYKVLKRADDAVLIEKIDDDNNPYTVSAKLLSEISNFTI